IHRGRLENNAAVDEVAHDAVAVGPVVEIRPARGDGMVGAHAVIQRRIAAVGTESTHRQPPSPLVMLGRGCRVAVGDEAARGSSSMPLSSAGGAKGVM